MQRLHLLCRPPLQKRSLARVLAIIAEMTEDGGVLSQDVPTHLLRHYGKKAEVSVVDILLDAMKTTYLVNQSAVSQKWGATSAGLAEYQAIKKDRPKLLTRTTSPQIPMHACFAA